MGRQTMLLLRGTGRWLGVAIGAAALAAGGCEEAAMPSERVVAGEGEQSRAVPTSALRAGPEAAGRARPNPYEGNHQAVLEGEQLYTWFNCGTCHGVLGGGGMGVPLADEAWIYGDEPDQIRASIVQGRPQGMPAYGGRIAEEQLWKIVAFVTSLHENTEEHEVAAD